jgi:hypothetical protein
MEYGSGGFFQGRGVIRVPWSVPLDDESVIPFKGELKFLYYLVWRLQPGVGEIVRRAMEGWVTFMISWNGIAIGFDLEGEGQAGGDERITALEQSILGDDPKILENSLARRACSKLGCSWSCSGEGYVRTAWQHPLCRWVSDLWTRESTGRIAAVLHTNAAQLDANGSAGVEHEASCRMMLMLLWMRPIIGQDTSWSGEVFDGNYWLCVSRVYNLMIMGSKNEYPYLLVPSIGDRGGAAFLRGIEDDEASLLSVAPEASQISCCRMINFAGTSLLRPLWRKQAREMLTPIS